MDDDNAPARRPPPTKGGTVEPADRAAVARERFQTPIEQPNARDVPGERYELRDPFADVTYRANSFADMVAKAEQLGSSRFIALDADGGRTTVRKVDGEWQRGPRRPAAPDRPLDDAPVWDDMPELPAGAARPPGRTEPADGKAIATIDAQAERTALIERLERALVDRYIIRRAPVTMGDVNVTIGRTEYRFRGDTSRVAFTESTFRLATDTNNPSVARSMVDVAEARNWRALRVSGNDDFKRMVWLEASVRGVKTLGYAPAPADLELLQKERDERRVNRIEPARDDRPGAGVNAASAAEKSPARGGGGRKAVLAAIEAVLVAKRVPAEQREAVMAAASEKLAQRLRAGQAPKVKVYDKAAAPHRTGVMPAPEVQRNRVRGDRAAPAR